MSILEEVGLDRDFIEDPMVPISEKIRRVKELGLPEVAESAMVAKVFVMNGISGISYRERHRPVFLEELLPKVADDLGLDNPSLLWTSPTQLEFTASYKGRNLTFFFWIEADAETIHLYYKRLPVAVVYQDPFTGEEVKVYQDLPRCESLEILHPVKLPSLSDIIRQALAAEEPITGE